MTPLIQQNSNASETTPMPVSNSQFNFPQHTITHPYIIAQQNHQIMQNQIATLQRTIAQQNSVLQPGQIGTHQNFQPIQNSQNLKNDINTNIINDTNKCQDTSADIEDHDISLKNPSKDSACASSNMTNDNQSTSSGTSNLEKEVFDSKNSNLCQPGTVIEV